MSSSSFAAAPYPAARPWLWMLLLACLTWAGVSWISSGNLDSYNDMLENYAWSQPMLLGTHKHPPFFAWVVGAWFSIFPESDWAYRLLSYVNVAVGLLGVHALGRRLGLGGLAAWGALLLLWSFPYTSLAGKFNANSQLLSLWPWAAALLLASWQDKGLRGLWMSVWLGLVAAACMLSKYYSGVFLAGFLVPMALHPDGRRWLLTPRPYVALAVFALALSPHVLWMSAHEWAPITYAMSQGEGGVVWRYVARFALSPLFYWLPAWLAVCLTYAFVHARLTGAPRARTAGHFVLRSWLPYGAGDVLYWLAVMPWALTLLCGVLGVAELSTPWAIPIGYAFALLWLRNLHALSPQTSDVVLAKLARAWWWVLGAVLVLGGVATWVSATQGDDGYYRPTREAAAEILQAWQQRHPGQTLGWVGGAWADNAMLTFYAQPGLHTVPGTPDSYPAQLGGLGQWQQRHGLLLCPLGPVRPDTRTDTNACAQTMQAWLRSQGLSTEAHITTSERTGWMFPQRQPFAYAVFDVMASAQP